MAKPNSTKRPHNFTDLTGHTFGFWTVISVAPRDTWQNCSRAHWICRCKCGRERSIPTNNLRNGASTQCRSCSLAKRIHTPQNLTGARFGNWVVIKHAPASKDGKTRWQCRCNCGRESVVRAASLLAGRSTQCKSCSGSTNRLVHGKSQSPEYAAWRSIHARCENTNNIGYGNYGGRGLTVCERWQSFDAFYKDMGPRPGTGFSVERIDNTRGYSPTNCMWATQKQQHRNKRTNRRITFQGKTQCLQDWAAETGLSRQCISHRLKRGWTIESALTTPSRSGHNLDNQTPHISSKKIPPV